MIKYELLSTIPLLEEHVTLPTQQLAELVHLDDPAWTVMVDFNQEPPHTISPDVSIDHALMEMKLKDVHLLLVTDKNHQILGLIASEDILGEKPITLIQQRRIERAQVLVKMVMTPLQQIVAFNIEVIERARVGNIVTTLKNLCAHYALAIKTDGAKQAVRGIFNTSQISKQLHVEINNAINKAHTVSELQKRQS
jgi:CBS domain containing-hemolysin-like protein